MIFKSDFHFYTRYWFSVEEYRIGSCDFKSMYGTYIQLFLSFQFELSERIWSSFL